MAAAVAGEVLGPRPGLAICSFAQGRLEIFLRIFAPLLGSLPALVAAAVALAEGNDVVSDPDIGQLRGATGLVIAIASLAIMGEVLVTILRFCNIGLINIKIKIFLSVAAVIGVLLILGHLAGGIVCALFAADRGSGIVRNALAASAAFCFLSVFLFALVVVWDIAFVVKGWNDRVVKYTLKQAITG